MENIIDCTKNNKYFWFYPKSRKDIKMVLNINSKLESKKILKKKFYNKDVALVLIKVLYREKTSKLFPDKIYILIDFFNLRNNRFKSDKEKLTGKVFFKNKTIKRGLKTSFLSRIVKKFYFDDVETPLLNFKYYDNL